MTNMYQIKDKINLMAMSSVVVASDSLSLAFDKAFYFVFHY